MYLYPAFETQRAKIQRHMIVIMCWWFIIVFPHYFFHGLIGGGFAGLALAFLLEFLSPGMTTPFSAERRLSLPVMVAIPRRT
jgi:hypothetical protein